MSAHEARRTGAFVVLQEGHVHHAFDEAIIRDEHRRLGLPFPGRYPMYQEAYANSDWVVAYSAFAAKSLADAGIPTDRVLINPLGVDLELFPVTTTPEARDRFTVLSVGTVGPRKGQIYLLEAVRDLLPECSVVLRGSVDPAMQSVLRVFDGLYQVAPAVPYADLKRYYQQADVFVLPSLSESFGLATLEAMASGLPVIVSENSASFVTDGYDGFIVPIRDPQAIRRRLEQLYGDRDLRLRMGRNARQTAERYTWAATRARHATIMRAAISAHAAGAEPGTPAWDAVAEFRFSK